MASKKHASVVVIGAGPGGYAAAFRSADLGKDVLLIDREPVLGGVCLNRGCIPSKALLHIARVMEEARSLNGMGVEFGSPKINIDSIREWKEKVIIQLNQGIAQMAKARKVETLQGTAAFKSNSELVVSVGSKKTTVSFDHCIIAAGSVSASAPGISMDHPDILTSRTALDLEKIPETLLVIGGGYIGLEIGTVYHALGSKVSVVEFMPALLPGADPDLVKPLFRKLSKQFEEIALSTKITGVEPATKSGLSVSLEKNGKTISREYDQVLMAVGRRPNTDHLQLGNTDIKTNEKNFITVDRKQKTAVDYIFAVGDIAGDPMLAHKATHEGKVAAEVIAGLPSAFDAMAIPAVIFTDPEIAWAGLTETEAKKNSVAYEKGEFPWAASGKSLAIGRNEGKTKILFDPVSKRTLGVGMVGPNAGDLISEGVLAIEMGADPDDISLTVHPHPTLSETFSNAAEVFAGTVTDIYVPKKKG